MYITHFALHFNSDMLMWTRNGQFTPLCKNSTWPQIQMTTWDKIQCWGWSLAWVTYCILQNFARREYQKILAHLKKWVWFNVAFACTTCPLWLYIPRPHGRISSLQVCSHNSQKFLAIWYSYMQPNVCLIAGLENGLERWNGLWNSR